MKHKQLHTGKLPIKPRSLQFYYKNAIKPTVTSVFQCLRNKQDVLDMVADRLACADKPS